MASNYCESCGMRDTELSHHDQCPVGEAQARAKDQVLALAMMMQECVCIDGITHPDSHGDDCKRSGSVPRFEGLRDYYSSQCGKPGCSCAMDWLPLPVAEAAGKLMDLPEFDELQNNDPQKGEGYSAMFNGLNQYGEMEAFRQYGDTWRHAVIAAAAAWAGVE